MYKNLVLGKIHNLMTGSMGVILFVVPPLAIVLLLLIISIVTANSRKNRMKRYAADSGYDFDNSIIEDTAVSYEQMNKQDSLKGSFNVFKQAEITKKDDEIQYAFKNGVMQDNGNQLPQNNEVMPLSNQPTPQPPMQNNGQGFNPMGMSGQQNQAMGNNFNGNQQNNGFVPLNAQRPMPPQTQNGGQGFNPMGMSGQQNQAMGNNFNGNQQNNGFVPLNAQRPMTPQMQNGGQGFNPMGMMMGQQAVPVNTAFNEPEINEEENDIAFDKDFEENIDKLDVEEEKIDLVQEKKSDIGLVEEDDEDRTYDYTPDAEAVNENYEDYQELNRIPTVNELFGKKQETEKIEEKTEIEEQPILNANFKNDDISRIIEKKSDKENAIVEEEIPEQDNSDEPESVVENSKPSSDEQEDDEESEKEQKEKDISDLKEFLKTL